MQLLLLVKRGRAKVYTFDKAPSVKKGLCGVYAIFLTSNPSVAYIGSSKCIRTRLMNHVNNLRKGSHKNWRLKSLWGIYEDEFRWKIVGMHHSEDDARAAEQLMLDFTPPEKLYNIDFKVYSYKRNK
jgi:hypothetical protein